MLAALIFITCVGARHACVGARSLDAEGACIVDAWSDCKKKGNKVLGRKSYGVSMREVANAMPNSMKIPDCHNTTRFRLHTKKATSENLHRWWALFGAYFCATFLFCRMVCEEASIDKEGALGGGPKRPQRKELSTFIPRRAGSVLDNTYAVETISTKSIYLTGMRKWRERWEVGEGRGHEEGGRRREDRRRAKVKQKNKSERERVRGKEQGKSAGGRCGGGETYSERETTAHYGEPLHITEKIRTQPFQNKYTAH